MKTTKLFFMAALALMTAACSNSDNDILTPAEQPANNMVTITAKLAPKSGSAQTRVLSDQTTYIKAEWAANETMKIISANGEEATATVKSVDGSGTATIEFSIYAAAVGQNCTIIYPASAAVTESAGVYTAQPMTVQTGTLSNDLDVRIGKGTISDATTLDVTTQPEAQFAIFKFTLSGHSIGATHPLVIKKGENEVVTTVTPASSTTSVYVAMPPAASSDYRFIVTTDNNKYIKSGTAAIAAGKYYQTTLDLSTARYPLALASATVDDLGSVIASDGNIYLKNAATPSGNTGVAMIAYVGNDAETSPTNTAFKNGLALALANANVSETKILWCSKDIETCLPTQYSTAETAKGDMAGIANTDALVGHAEHTHYAAKAAREYSVTRPADTSEWFLPSAGQWDKMANAAGGYEKLGLPPSEDGYWSSTEFNASSAWYFDDDNGKWEDNSKKDDNQVRACLAF